jgi:hydrogenase maturation factor HypE
MKLYFFHLDYFFAFVCATGRAGTVGQFGGLTLRTGGDRLRGQEIVSPSHIFAGLGRFFLGYCHKISPL